MFGLRHANEINGKKVIVLGLARSGVSVAKWLHRHGAEVIVNDRKPREESPEAAALEQLNIEVICGQHPISLIHPGVDFVVKNPGIPYTVQLLAKAAELGIPIITEVELAQLSCRAPIIGITGSNGKTTTTSWIGEILRLAGRQPIIAGNIGRALCDAAMEAADDNVVVAELSSFQLKGTSRFKPYIACLLNVHEAHLDYHKTMEDYVQSKTRIFANQTAEDYAVYNADQPICIQAASVSRAIKLPFSASDQLDCGVFRQNGQIVFRLEDGLTHIILPEAELGVPGRHNVENALAAAAVCLAAGVSPAVIADGLRLFRGVEHRLEYVAEMDGVKFYNDSKATNPQATIRAIDSFPGRIILIAGGLDRGIDFMELVPFFETKLKALISLGESQDKLNHIAKLAGISFVKSVDNVTESVLAAFGAAEPGDVVLLSPACASWDMFASYEERGRIFKESVHSLLKR